tara:strand:- start:222543 stop:223565 length:1023 start_codon:yes stop_codon:yes gene_type:complete
MFDPAHCHVERTREQNYLIRWRLSAPGQRVAIHMSDNPHHYYSSIQPGTPLLYTCENEALILNPDKAVRHYFYLKSEQGEAIILAERQLTLQGSPNFRDLGGYKADDGRHLKWGRLYRSSKLSTLTDIDMQYVRRLGLTLICDFRQVVEQELEPSRIHLEDAPILASLPVMPGSSASFLENLHNGIIAVADPAAFMEEMNRDYVINQMPQYAEMFQLLLAGDQQLLIHCASGKDRTGVGAALILDVLGVNEETIVNDYLLTNKYLPIETEVARLTKEFSDHSGSAISAAALRPLLEVRPEYIRACFEEIKKRYESKEHFYESALSLDTAKVIHLKNRYLH